MNTLKHILLAFVFSFISNTAIACTEPEAPVLPDPATAVTPQMIKAKNDVQAFLADAEAFLNCTKSNKKHNIMVDNMNDVANQFNEIIRAYKARVSS